MRQHVAPVGRRRDLKKTEQPASRPHQGGGSPAGPPRSGQRVSMSASSLHVTGLACQAGVAVAGAILPSVGVGQQWSACARGGQAAARLWVLIARPRESSNPRGHG